MKKLKAVLLTIAIISGVSMAIASTTKAACDSENQYWKYGNNYYPAGIEGYDFVCSFAHFTTCTYYYNTELEMYLPCKSGQLLWLR